jgi:hypothetical protein
LKSSTVKLMPMHSMVNASAGVMRGRNQSNKRGCLTPRNDNAMTHAGNSLVARSRTSAKAVAVSADVVLDDAAACVKNVLAAVGRTKGATTRDGTPPTTGLGGKMRTNPCTCAKQHMAATISDNTCIGTMLD